MSNDPALSDGRVQPPEKPLSTPRPPGAERPDQACSGRCPGSPGLSQNLLVKIGEEVDSERVLLVELVAISIFHSVQCVGRGCVFQENIPESRERAAHKSADPKNSQVMLHTPGPPQGL